MLLLFSKPAVVVPDVPDGWQIDPVPLPPGDSASWGSVPAPVAPVASATAPVYGRMDHTVVLAGVNITGLVEQVSMSLSESSALGSCDLTLPVGIKVDQGAALVVTVGGVAYHWVVDEVGGDGPTRSVWCLSAACALDEPYAAEISYNNIDTPFATAQALATALCGSVQLGWQIDDWTLPPRWQLSGTPIACLQQLVAAVGAIIQPSPAGGLIARRRWPVRPVAMAGATPSATLNRSTALADNGISSKSTSGTGHGSITVYGYDPSADLPTLELETESPTIGSPALVKAFWRDNDNHPAFSTFITDGTAASLGFVSAPVTDEVVVFENGTGSTRYPVTALGTVTWIGNSGGTVSRVTDGDNKQLIMSAPSGRGLAKISYTTRFERFQLTGQSAATVIFGGSVGAGQVSATVKYSSGGSVAPAVTAPLLNSTTACIAAGTAALDAGRSKATVSGSLPVAGAPLQTGMAIAVTDAVSGVIGVGKLSSVTIELGSGRSVQNLEVEVCH